MLIDDDDVEGEETFSISLLNPSGTSTFGIPSVAGVTIMDNGM